MPGRFGANYPFSTGTPVGETGTIRWFKAEPIKWLIGDWDALPKSINPAGTGTAGAMHLVAAEVVTGGIPFGEMYVRWPDSTVRKFLNEAFLNEAFDAATRAKIAQTTVPNPTTFNLEGNGTPTTDKVFLLSTYEMWDASGIYHDVFGNGLSEKCQGLPTDFAMANNSRIRWVTDDTTNPNYEYNGRCEWWMRFDHTKTGSSVPVCMTELGLSIQTCDTTNTVKGIRPAVVLPLGSLYP
ncbi:MAG: DUF6273 domain-containing protein [Firmicutes bacterium]|nr:DUF6273 domain-containing protein [Bacillota bacterium]